jgi:hypothetical protein
MSAASSTKRIAAVALAAAGVAGLAGSTAQAAPFLTARLLGSTTGPGGPFSSSVNVQSGDTVNYQIQITLGDEGASNATTGTTIVNWVPSNGSTSPTSGLNSLLFSLTQSAGDGIQSNFSSTAAGTSTGGGSWGAGTGNAPGTVTARGNGNNNLLNVRLFRESGNFDGVAGTPTTAGQADPSPAVLETLVIATGSFTIASGGSSGTVKMDLTGFTAGQIIAAYRWRDATNTNNINTNETVNTQNNSVTAGDPVIVFQPLQLVPEPATLGLLGVAGLGLLARRKRA